MNQEYRELILNLSKPLSCGETTCTQSTAISACGETTCTQSTAISACGETTCTQSTAVPVQRGYDIADFKEELTLSLAS